MEVPASVDDTASGLLQVLGTCVHAQRTIEVFPGQVAAVVGLGVAGQLMAQLLALRGAVVAGFTRSPAKREWRSVSAPPSPPIRTRHPTSSTSSPMAAAPRSWSRPPGTSPRWPWQSSWSG